MSQVLLIFRKDVRHHWPEVLLSLALLVTFALEQPRQWTQQAIESRFLSNFLHFLPAIMVASWVFLIVRLVQGESLVGDRLFWVTRPYEWHKLLAAKLLFVVLLLHLPLFMSQVVLLKMASFPVISSIRGLLFVHFLLVIAIVLPSLSLASITSGIGQAALVILAAFLLLIGIAFLVTTVIPEADLASGTDSLDGLLYIAGCLTVIFVQYVYRKTLLSRLIVAGASSIIVLILVGAPYGRIINHDFPLPTETHPLPAHLALDRGLSFSHLEGRRSNFFGDEVELEIPFQITELDEKTILRISAIKLDLELPGEHWSSRWRRLNQSISFGRTRAWPDIAMKKSLFNRIKDTPVRAHVSLGYNIYRAGSATQVSMAGDRLILPGGGRCVSGSSDNWLQCFAALKQPRPLLIMAALPNASCQVTPSAISEGLAASPALFSDLTADNSPDLGFSPIEQFSISFTRFFAFEDHEIRLPVCPGTPLFVSSPKFLYAVRDEIDLGDITLNNYLPTYPRRIVPPHPPLSPGTPSNSLSLNLSPRHERRGPS
jgi:hypothetical protein